MALYEKLKADYEFCDERGKLTQLVHNGYVQINVLESRKGVVRGGHYHKITNEAFFVVSGSVDVTLKRDSEKEVVRFEKDEFFLIKSFVVHSMSFSEDCVLIALYDTPVELVDGTKDIYSKEL